LLASRARLRFARRQRCTATPPGKQEQAARRCNQWRCHGHDGRTRCSDGSLVFCLDKGVHFTLTVTEGQAARFLDALEETCSGLAFLFDVADRVLSKSVGTHQGERAGNDRTPLCSSLQDG
jgi:hypothetical protein